MDIVFRSRFDEHWRGRHAVRGECQLTGPSLCLCLSISANLFSPGHVSGHVGRPNVGSLEICKFEIGHEALVHGRGHAREQQLNWDKLQITKTQVNWCKRYGNPQGFSWIHSLGNNNRYVYHTEIVAWRVVTLHHAKLHSMAKISSLFFPNPILYHF